jgi:superfamily I DNA/RNA helicase
VPEQQNDLFLVGDAHQSIYSRKTLLSRAGINVRGRSRRLLLNYRTTEQIGRWAMAWITGGQYDDLDVAPENLRGYRSLISGFTPLDLPRLRGGYAGTERAGPDVSKGRLRLLVIA